METNNPPAYMISLLKNILYASITEWPFYLILVLPLAGFRLIKIFFFKNMYQASAAMLMIALLIGILDVILICRLSKKMVNEKLDPRGYYIQAAKHSLKMFAVFFVMLMAGISIAVFSGSRGGLVFNIPVYVFTIVFFLANYGVSSIIITGTSKKSVRAAFRYFKSSYTLYNLAFSLMVLFVTIIGQYIPAGSAEKILHNLLLLLFLVMVPFFVVFLSRYALDAKLFAEGDVQ